MRTVRFLAAISVLLGNGCAARFAVLGDPTVSKPPAVAAGQELTLTVRNVDLATAGLYFAPNIIPALNPSFAAASALARPEPALPEPSSWATRPSGDVEVGQPTYRLPDAPRAPQGDSLAWLRAMAAKGDRGAARVLAIQAARRGGN